MTMPGVYGDTFAGTADVDYDLSISEQYETALITITGLAEGVINLRALPKDGTKFEKVISSNLVAPDYCTTRISGYRLKALRFTPSQTAAFSVFVVMQDPIQTSTR